MFKALGWIFKAGVFAVLVLVLGNWVGWGGKSLSEHLRFQGSAAGKSSWSSSIQHWISKVNADTERGLTKRREIPMGEPAERISSREQEKLKSLIRTR